MFGNLGFKVCDGDAMGKKCLQAVSSTVLLFWDRMIACAIQYYILSHTLKNTANQRPGLPLHILRYSTLLSRHYLRAKVYWGLFEDLSKASSRISSSPENHYEHFRSRPEIFRRFSNSSEDFRRFSENFKKS